MTKQDLDPHSRYFNATREAFDLVRGSAAWQNPRVAALLAKIRRRVLAGGFPVNMAVEPLQYDAVVESVRVPKSALPALRGECDTLSSARQQIQKAIRSMDRERRWQRAEIGTN
ncbi:MAG: hypothetical protein PHX87_06535 [Candidatus Peribacteraceae bacterium]|nr:hypothetical protein [Candidatus Peribacteraceae bacterium]MDD5743046.1 hypothetical protein [Candidatus Peribacteraceae bacterium]